MPVIPREKWDSIEQYLEYVRSLAAYVLFAKQFVDDRKVLEIGCGTGYGANELGSCASSIIALDISRERILYCQAKYRKSNVSFLEGNGLALPFETGTFDVVMSFQVIEHIEPKLTLEYLKEIRRVLRSGGIFICSTPNKKIRLLPLQKPWNPEHKKEYSLGELKYLLNKVFEEVKIYGLCGSDEIQAIERNRVKQNPFEVYIVAPLSQMLKRLLPFPLLVRLRKHFITKRINGKAMRGEDFVNKFSLNDFKIDPTCPKNSLDLYGICTEVKERDSSR